MHYIDTPNFDHGQAPRIGVLICNLGTPEAPDRKALKSYLKQFLSDPRVIELPRLLWWLILHGVILRIRPSRSAKSYARVWTEEGSPLMAHTRDLQRALSQSLHQQYGDDLACSFAMRYGEPSVPAALDSLLSQGARRLLVIPLYPQYSGTTTASVFDAVAADFSRRRWLPELRFVPHYHDFAPYIDALAASVQAHWQQYGRAEKLIFSYHGTPRRYHEAGDPYFCECQKTSRLLAEALDLSDEEYEVCFQSRFGREPWLQPYLVESLSTLASQGVRSVQILCPGFSADCLETLEEIAMENREHFLEAGGERFEYIPALNSEPAHVAMLEALIEQQMQGWSASEDAKDSKQRALRLGARS